MPRTYPPKRTLTAVRLSPEGLAAVDVLAEQEQRTRSAMVRILLQEAIAARQATTVHVPTTWKDGRATTATVVMVGRGGAGGSGRIDAHPDGLGKGKKRGKR